MLTKVIIYLEGKRHVGLWLALLGLLISALFCTIIYPHITGPYGAVLDPDNYGVLGHGLWKNHTLSYYPMTEPTVERGPVYPAFIAGILAVTNGSWPLPVQLAQCVLFSLTILMVFWVAATIWNRRVGVLAGGLCVIHPFLIWYTSRIWIEIVGIFLFTALMAVMVYWSLRPTLLRTILVGCVLAVCALCKSTFLPYAIFAPAALYLSKAGSVRLRSAALMIVVAVVLVIPWTARNWKLTGKFVPVHVLAGMNCQIGDGFIESYKEHPLSFNQLWNASLYRRTQLEASVPKSLPLAHREVLVDSVFLNDCATRYKAHPIFIAKKIALNSLLFWTLGDEPKKTIIISALELPIAILFMLIAIRTLRREGLRSIRSGIIMMILAYYFMHLPIVAAARYSVILIPTMIVFAAEAFAPRLNCKSG